MKLLISSVDSGYYTVQNKAENGHFFLNTGVVKIVFLKNLEKTVDSILYNLVSEWQRRIQALVERHPSATRVLCVLSCGNTTVADRILLFIYICNEHKHKTSVEINV